MYSLKLNGQEFQVKKDSLGGSFRRVKKQLQVNWRYEHFEIPDGYEFNLNFVTYDKSVLDIVADYTTNFVEFDEFIIQNVNVDITTSLTKDKREYSVSIHRRSYDNNELTATVLQGLRYGFGVRGAKLEEYSF
jgi:hypothetical protein